MLSADLIDLINKPTVDLHHADGDECKVICIGYKFIDVQIILGHSMHFFSLFNEFTFIFISCFYE